MDIFNSIDAIERPLTADAVYEALKRVHRQLVIEHTAAGKTEDWMPAWFAHLPSGEKVRIRWFGTAGRLVSFTTPEGSPLIVAPQAVAITIEPLSEDEEGFPVEFLERDEDE